MRNFLLASSLVALGATSAGAEEQMKTLELPSGCTAILNEKVRKAVGNIQTGVYDILFCYGENVPTGIEMMPGTMFTYGKETQKIGMRYIPQLKLGDLVKLHIDERSRGKIGRTLQSRNPTFFQQIEGSVGFIPSTDFQCFQETFINGRTERNCETEIPNAREYSEKGHITFQNIPGRVSFILDGHIIDEGYEI